MPQLACRMKDRIQPFERQLALQELRALTNGPVVPVDGDDATASVFNGHYRRQRLRAARHAGVLAFNRRLRERGDSANTERGHFRLCPHRQD